jgi:hypothetical protein
MRPIGTEHKLCFFYLIEMKCGLHSPHPPLLLKKMYLRSPFFYINLLYKKNFTKYSSRPLLIGVMHNEKKKKKKKRVQYLKIFQSCKQVTQISRHLLLTFLLLQCELREVGGVHRCNGPTGESPKCLLVKIFLWPNWFFCCLQAENSAGQPNKCSWI